MNKKNIYFSFILKTNYNILKKKNTRVSATAFVIASLQNINIVLIVNKRLGTNHAGIELVCLYRSGKSGLKNSRRYYANAIKFLYYIYYIYIYITYTSTF